MTYPTATPIIKHITNILSLQHLFKIDFKYTINNIIRKYSLSQFYLSRSRRIYQLRFLPHFEDRFLRLHIPVFSSTIIYLTINTDGSANFSIKYKLIPIIINQISSSRILTIKVCFLGSGNNTPIAKYSNFLSITSFQSLIIKLHVLRPDGPGKKLLTRFFLSFQIFIRPQGRAGQENLISFLIFYLYYNKNFY